MPRKGNNSKRAKLSEIERFFKVLRQGEQTNTTTSGSTSDSGSISIAGSQQSSVIGGGADSPDISTVVELTENDEQ